MTFQEFKSIVTDNCFEGEITPSPEQFSHTDGTYVHEYRGESFYQMIRYSLPAQEWMLLINEKHSTTPSVLGFGATLDDCID